MTRLTVAMRLYFALFLLAVLPEFSSAADRPQWGHRHSRNMISPEKGLPDWFEPGERDPETGEIDLATTENVKWVTRLGSRTYCSPVVAEGRVFIGTNNDAPRDPRVEGDRGVLMCFDEATGKFLWQLTVPKIDWIRFFDAPKSGLTSPPTVDDGRLYVVTNRGEVMCLDIEGMANGNDGPYEAEGRHMALPDQPPFETGRNDADILCLITHDPWIGKDDGWLACIDVTKRGDVTRSGLIWSYEGISDCLSTVSIADSLLYIADYSGRLHCLDVETGQRYWMEELGGRIWGSTLLADGKVYVGTDRCELWVLEAARDARVISRIRMRDQIFTTPVAANGVLYVATAKHLYALSRNRNNGNY